MCKVVVLGLTRHFDTDYFSDTSASASIESKGKTESGSVSVGDIALTVWGCKALTYLAANMINNHQLGAAGGCDLITQVLYKYVKKQSNVIVQHGWGAVINLTLWEENNLR
jgi:hypothetical protein